MRLTLAILVTMSATLSACSGDPYRGVYEAVKSRNESAQTPTERSVTPTPSYDSYQKEREQRQ
ncbi:MAG TPA: hypothetical protein VFR06_06475 [Gallionellaceae bacterium]|nr:hypothetical protein [Gallionellaceae bacterium]